MARPKGARNLRFASVRVTKQQLAALEEFRRGLVNVLGFEPDSGQTIGFLIHQATMDMAEGMPSDLPVAPEAVDAASDGSV